MRILTVNAGSSTLKLNLLDEETVVAGRQVETSDRQTAEDALAGALAELDRPDAVAHRVVHGGGEFTRAVRIDPEVRVRLEEFAALAPLHQAPSLLGIDLTGRLLPDVPAVACFDTAFHSTLAPEAYTYAVPEDWRSRLGLRRFGFHGLSHAYAARRATAMLGGTEAAGAADWRLVICHLGAGASLSAVRGGLCADTTMGYTPLEGLVMATRSGSVDPGMLLWLLRHAGLSSGELEDALQHRSGLAGLAGTPDMRAILQRAGEGDERAKLAIDVYVHRLRGGIATMAASLGGLDALVFTGGVGENAPAVRSAAVRGLEFLGLGLDPERNTLEPDVDVTLGGAASRCLVIAAGEHHQMAAEVRALLTAG